MPVDQQDNVRQGRVPPPDPLGRDILCFEHSGNWLDYMTHGDPGLQPVVLLHSVEYPGWPSPAYAGLLESAGFRLIAVRRPGFARLPLLPDAGAQAGLLLAFLELQDFEDAIVLSNGSASPVGQRIALGASPRIALSVFANCAFNHDHVADFQPEWFARTLSQAITSRAGAQMALMALKSSWAIFGRTWVHESFLQKSEGDLAFLQAHPELVADAIDSLLDGLDAQTFLMEAATSLNPDPLLSDGCFTGLPALTVSGAETSDRWKQGVEREAARLGLPVEYLPSGDAMAIYQSGLALAETLRRHL